MRRLCVDSLVINRVFSLRLGLLEGLRRVQVGLVPAAYELGLQCRQGAVRLSIASHWQRVQVVRAGVGAPAGKRNQSSISETLPKPLLLGTYCQGLFHLTGAGEGALASKF